MPLWGSGSINLFKYHTICSFFRKLISFYICWNPGRDLFTLLPNSIMIQTAVYYSSQHKLFMYIYLYTCARRSTVMAWFQIEREGWDFDRKTQQLKRLIISTQVLKLLKDRLGVECPPQMTKEGTAKHTASFGRSVS